MTKIKIPSNAQLLPSGLLFTTFPWTSANFSHATLNMSSPVRLAVSRTIRGLNRALLQNYRPPLSTYCDNQLTFLNCLPPLPPLRLSHHSSFPHSFWRASFHSARHFISPLPKCSLGHFLSSSPLNIFPGLLAKLIRFPLSDSPACQSCSFLFYGPGWTRTPSHTRPSLRRSR